MNTNPKNFPACHSSDRNRAALAILILTVLGLGWWCNARADTLLFEGFEGNFPLDNGWSVGDSNSAGTSAFWNDVSAPFGTAGAHAGNRKGYCAGIGFAGAAAAPLYQTNMDAYLRRTLDLRSYCSSSLSFWCRTPAIETCCAYLIVSLGGTVVIKAQVCVRAPVSGSVCVSHTAASAIGCPSARCRKYGVFFALFAALSGFFHS